MDGEGAAAAAAAAAAAGLDDDDELAVKLQQDALEVSTGSLLFRPFYVTLLLFLPHCVLGNIGFDCGTVVTLILLYAYGKCCI
jgi:hypothetical protein